MKVLTHADPLTLALTLILALKLQLAIELDVKPKSLEQRLRSEVTHKNVKKEVTVDDEVKELDFEELVDRQAKGEKYVFQNTAADWLDQVNKLRLRIIARNIFGEFIGIFEPRVFEFSRFDVSVCGDQVLV